MLVSQRAIFLSLLVAGAAFGCKTLTAQTAFEYSKDNPVQFSVVSASPTANDQFVEHRSGNQIHQGSLAVAMGLPSTNDPSGIDSEAHYDYEQIAVSPLQSLLIVELQISDIKQKNTKLSENDIEMWSASGIKYESYGFPGVKAHAWNPEYVWSLKPKKTYHVLMLFRVPKDGWKGAHIHFQGMDYPLS